MMEMYDAGYSKNTTVTTTNSADMTTAAAITAAPSAGQLVKIVDIIFSSDTAMNFIFQEETSATQVAKIFVAANTPVQITPRGQLKTFVAGKKLMGKASVAGNVAVTVIYVSEA